jgi:hypothetical protein
MMTFTNKARRGLEAWWRGSHRAAAASVLAGLMSLLAIGTAFADEYEPVTGTTARAATDPNPFIIGAYGFVWVALVLYVVGIARGLARAKAEIAELQRRVAATGPATTGGLKR